MAPPPRRLGGLGILPVALLLLAGCASAPSVSHGAVLEEPEVDLSAFVTLDSERAVCVAGALHDQAQRDARRLGRSVNRSPVAQAERDLWFARRLESDRIAQINRASQMRGANPWAQQVLANSVYFIPGDTQARSPRGTMIGLTRTQYEALITGAPERRAIMARDAEGFRTLAEAHLRAVETLVAAAGRADDPVLALAARNLAEQVLRDPVLEAAYQEEFILEYNHGERCGPAPSGASKAEIAAR